jgi:4-amino-4-deoxy-L-arabinose transferase-like glycosyltransferase
LDANPWKQAEIAAIARNFYENGFKIFYPQIDWGGASDGYVESGFQIYPFIVALLYKLFGVYDWIGRVLSLGFSVGSTILIFRFTHKIIDYRTAVWASLFFVISPLNIHFSRAFMPTSMLVCCSIASIHYFNEWVNNGRWYSFLLSVFATALAVLIKLPFLYLGIPLLYLAVRRYERNTFVQWQMWLFAILVIFPSIAWYYHARQLFLETHLTFGIWGEGTSKFGNIDYWLDIDFYKTMASKLINDILPFGGLALAVIGVSLRLARRNYVVVWWSIAFGIYIMLVAEGHKVHYYYQVPLVPMLSILMAQGISYLWGKDLFRDSFLKDRVSSKLILAVLCIVMLLTSLARVKDYQYFDPERLEYGKRIEQLTEKGSLIIIGGWNKGSHLKVQFPCRDPIDLYHSHRRGWEIDLDEWSISLIDSLKQQGARYFATFYPMGLDKNKAFAERMKNKYSEIEATDRWVIYGLD